MHVGTTFFRLLRYVLERNCTRRCRESYESVPCHQHKDLILQKCTVSLQCFCYFHPLELASDAGACSSLWRERCWHTPFYPIILITLILFVASSWKLPLPHPTPEWGRLLLLSPPCLLSILSVIGRVQGTDFTSVSFLRDPQWHGVFLLAHGCVHNYLEWSWK